MQDPKASIFNSKFTCDSDDCVAGTSPCPPTLIKVLDTSSQLTALSRAPSACITISRRCISKAFDQRNRFLSFSFGNIFSARSSAGEARLACLTACTRELWRIGNRIGIVSILASRDRYPLFVAAAATGRRCGSVGRRVRGRSFLRPLRKCSSCERHCMRCLSYFLRLRPNVGPDYASNSTDNPQSSAMQPASQPANLH